MIMNQITCDIACITTVLQCSGDLSSWPYQSKMWITLSAAGYSHNWFPYYYPVDSAIQRINNQDLVVFTVCVWLRNCQLWLTKICWVLWSIPLIAMWPVNAGYAFAVVKTASNKSLYILQVEIKFRLILM